ncbi:Crp/Fnr family transcriptional regulator [Neptuniibacter sp.]|uniref:Crp/Fnr family transcriptional regulator n=1 Tax=Neptuniibacter sp. TaxID=1962643 RepID=UPI002620A3E9|nr:Crp/Fnr family transcriptional regulator [Neptuniibacter sp.]MCP4595132.1 Crp/Fnr family transcriptional regulator [Neptuniibacter sp.]
MASQLLQKYPELQNIDEAGAEILKQAQQITAPAGSVLFRQGDSCNNFIMVTSGSVKVVGRGESGREIVLYRIENRGTCVITTSCLLGKQHYPAEGIAETDIQAYLLPLSAFEEALSSSGSLRQFIFSSYSYPLAEMIELVQSVAFESIENRLIEYLVSHTDSSMKIERSHQQIADELGSAREVISRHLKRLEQQQLIRLERGCIHICDLDQLCSVT